MVLPDSHRVPRAPRYLGSRFKSRAFRIHGYHILWPSFPTRSTSLLIGNFTHAVLQPHSRFLLSGLGCFHFARRYFGNHCCFLLLQVLRWFTSLGLLHCPILFRQRYMSSAHVGSPIRTSAGQRMLAPHRSFSQLATSFIASKCQGIHRVPLVA